MWKPPERIRYETRPGEWPDAEQAARSLLFSPLRNKKLSLATRTWIPAMVPWRASLQGDVTPEVIDWYERFARGRPGAIVIEATGIRDIPSGPLLRISDDRYIPGLKKIVRAVKSASGGETKLFIQLIDFLGIKRRPPKDRYIRQFLKITDAHARALGLGRADEIAIREALLGLDDPALANVLTKRETEALLFGARERVTDTHIPAIKDLPQTLPGLFAKAAYRAEQAGFDGVELHYAHAYTMASFLSKLNTRGDGYGGPTQRRIRLPLEVLEAAQKATGPDFIIGCRLLSEDCISGGSDISDSIFFAAKLAEAGLDFLSLSRGGKFEDATQPAVGQAIYPYTGRSGYECMPHFISDQQGPFGRNVAPSAQIRHALRQQGQDIPIITAGGIHSFEQAEAILQNGQADVIALARQSLADPDWFLKARSGHGADIRTCKYSNYCEGLDQKHKIVTCQLWDRSDLDSKNIRLTPDGKRRLTAPDWP